MGDGDRGSKGSDRRAHPRCLVCAAVGVQPKSAGEHRAVLRDISISGACFLSRIPLEPGEALRLEIQFGGDGEKRSGVTEAEVVRVEQLDPERADVWSHQIAVRFTEPLEGFDDEIRDLADKLSRAGLPW